MIEKVSLADKDICVSYYLVEFSLIVKCDLPGVVAVRAPFGADCDTFLLYDLKAFCNCIIHITFDSTGLIITAIRKEWKNTCELILMILSQLFLPALKTLFPVEQNIVTGSHGIMIP